MVDDKKRIVNQANVYEGLKDRSFMEAQFTVYAPTNILFKKKSWKLEKSAYSVKRTKPTEMFFIMVYSCSWIWLLKDDYEVLYQFQVMIMNKRR